MEWGGFVALGDDWSEAKETEARVPSRAPKRLDGRRVEAWSDVAARGGRGSDF